MIPMQNAERALLLEWVTSALKRAREAERLLEQARGALAPAEDGRSSGLCLGCGHSELMHNIYAEAKPVRSWCFFGHASSDAAMGLSPCRCIEFKAPAASEGSPTTGAGGGATDVGEFYLRRDWYFLRLDDGSVQIGQKSSGETMARWRITFSAVEWRSIVAHVSKDGDASYHAVEALHGGAATLDAVREEEGG